jgi:hypothetical protein
MLLEIIVDPEDFHRVFYCIVFGELILDEKQIAATKKSHKKVILTG